MTTFTKEDTSLVVTKQVETKWDREGLLEEMRACEYDLERAKMRLAAVKTLLAECDKLGL